MYIRYNQNQYLMESKRSLSTYVLIVTLLLGFSQMAGAQEKAKIKSIKQDKKDPDHPTVRISTKSANFQLTYDLSSVATDASLDKAGVEQLVEQGEITTFQPANLKQTETDSVIRLFSQSNTPDEFELGGATFHKTIVDLGQVNGKKVLTQFYTQGQTKKKLDNKMNLKFKWKALSIDKDCKKPVCEEWAVRDGKAVCVKIRCD